MGELSGEAALRAELPAPYELHMIEQVDSTPAEAMRLAADGADEGTLVWAAEQTDGRRQDGRPWFSPTGGLYAAVILRPELPPDRWPQLIAVAAVSLGAAIAELCQPMTPLRYAWPDRLLLGPDDVASLTYSANADSVILSWAVNVAAGPTPGIHACLELDGGAEASPGEVLGRTSRFFLDWLNRWAEDGFEPVRRAWLARRLLESSSAADGSARAVELEDNGDLRVETAEGEAIRTLSGALTSATAPPRNEDR